MTVQTTLSGGSRTWLRGAGVKARGEFNARSIYIGDFGIRMTSQTLLTNQSIMLYALAPLSTVLFAENYHLSW